ncbi:hypothetical protein ONZ45_g14242 [Pleurotus djamor]|nr:hypothetical protein ONZ45_g14242 [Pleurotus djamor]
MNRTIDDYDSMAKREIIKAKQEKAQMRVQKFRSDYAELRAQFEILREKATAELQRSVRNFYLHRAVVAAKLVFRRPQMHEDVSRRHIPPSSSTLHPGLRPNNASETIAESPFRGNTPTPGISSREHHALNEHTFIQNTEARLDDFLAQGREVLDNLVDQRNMLKGTQRRLLDAANTLGLSRDVIGWIERRSTQDMYIFFAGAIFTFVCFYLIWKYLG